MAKGKKGPNILLIVGIFFFVALLIGFGIWGILSWQKKNSSTVTTTPPPTTMPPTTMPPTTMPPTTMPPTTTPSTTTTSPPITTTSPPIVATMPRTPGYSEFQSKFNGQYLGVASSTQGWHPALVDYGGYSWRWDISQVPGTNNLYLTDTATGNRLGITRDSGFHGGYKVNIKPGAVRTIWIPEDAGDGYIRLKNESTGTYLSICDRCPGYNPGGLSITAHHYGADQSSHILWRVINATSAT